MLTIKFSTFSRFWLKTPVVFDPIQRVFNGNLWQIIRIKFSGFTQGKVIDLACGTGELRHHIQPQTYLGVDINPAYIKYARQKFKHHQVKFIVADASLYRPDMEFDTAFLISAAHHLSDPQFNTLLQNIRASKIRKIIIIDDIPIGPFAKLLAYLDANLGNGRYFRTTGEIVALTKKYFQVKDQGEFRANLSFYRYTYVIASNDNFKEQPISSKE